MWQMTVELTPQGSVMATGELRDVRGNQLSPLQKERVYGRETLIKPIAGALPDGIEFLDSLVRIGEDAQVPLLLMASSAVIPTAIEPKLIAYNSDEYSKDPKPVSYTHLRAHET